MLLKIGAVRVKMYIILDANKFMVLPTTGFIRLIYQLQKKKKKNFFFFFFLQLSGCWHFRLSCFKLELIWYVWPRNVQKLIINETAINLSSAEFAQRQRQQKITKDKTNDTYKTTDARIKKSCNRWTALERSVEKKERKKKKKKETPSFYSRETSLVQHQIINICRTSIARTSLDHGNWFGALVVRATEG